MRRQGHAEFPDAVTVRGAKHLDELAAMVAAGHRAVMLFLIQIGSAERFGLAADIDPTYARAFARARAAGVEALAYRCAITTDGIAFARAVEIEEAMAPVSAPPPRLRAGRSA
jgi:sugar fermentation stimulation protein A